MVIILLLNLFLTAFDIPSVSSVTAGYSFPGSATVTRAKSVKSAVSGLGTGSAPTSYNPAVPPAPPSSPTLSAQANAGAGLRAAPVPRFDLGATLQGKVESFVGSKMLDYFVTRFIQVNKMDGFRCTIKITHNLQGRSLVNPKVFLNRGTTRTPPPYRIDAGFEEIDEKFAIFDADDKITKRDFVSTGILTYEIADKYIFYIIWSVKKHGTFMLGDGTNSFYFLVKDRALFKSPWQKILKAEYDAALLGTMYQASQVGRYVELEKRSPDGSLEFTIRGHMSNDKNAQLIFSIEEPKAKQTPLKRDVFATLPLTALFTVAGTLATMALRHLPTETQKIVVTIHNDFGDVALHDPIWHLKNAVIMDSIPYEIPALEKKQITFSVPFGFTETKFKEKTKHSAVVLTFKIEGGGEARLALAIWWEKKFSISEYNHFSVFLMQGIPSEGVLDNIAKNRLQSGAGVTESIPVKEYQNYMCKEDQYQPVAAKAVGGTVPTPRTIRLVTTMGDSTESNMIVAIGDRKGNKFDIIRYKFQDCLEIK